MLRPQVQWDFNPLCEDGLGLDYSGGTHKARNGAENAFQQPPACCILCRKQTLTIEVQYVEEREAEVARACRHGACMRTTQRALTSPHQQLHQRGSATRTLPSPVPFHPHGLPR